MKLIYAKGACSLAVHILLEELELKYETYEVSLQDKTELNRFTNKSYVPVLILDNHETLTEATAILQYLAENQGDHTFLPSAGSLDKGRCLEWLAYLSSEIHKGLAPLFHQENINPEYIEEIRQKLDTRLTYLNRHLLNRDFLIRSYSIADMYAIAILRLLDYVKVDLQNYPALVRYRKKMESLPKVKKAIEDERNAARIKAA